MSNASPDKRCESWCGSTECVHPRSCKQTSLSHVAPINVPVAQTVEHGPAVTATFQPAPEVAGSIPAGDAPPEARQTVPVPNPPSTVSPCAPHNVVGCDRCAAFYWQAMYENACVEMEQTTPSTTPQKPEFFGMPSEFVRRFLYRWSKDGMETDYDGEWLCVSNLSYMPSATPRKPVAWRLVNAKGWHCQWCDIYPFDPQGGGLDSKRNVADTTAPDEAPHRWEPLYAE